MPKPTKPDFHVNELLTLTRNGCEYRFDCISENGSDEFKCVHVTRVWDADPPDTPPDEMGMWTRNGARAMWQTLVSGGYIPKS